MKLYRTDIVIALLIPLVLGMMHELHHGGVQNILLLSAISLVLLCEVIFLFEEDGLNRVDNSRYIYFLLSIIIMLAWIFSVDMMIYIFVICAVLESFFLFREDAAHVNDTGRAVSFFSSTIVTVTWLFSEKVNNFVTVISIMLILTGIACRLFAKLKLRKNYSFSLRIKSDHKLVTSGIYKYVRHPAYLGMQLIFLGVTSWLPPYVQIVMMMISFITAEFRARKEEEMLIQHFGDKYVKYIASSKKFIPYVY